MSLHVVSPLLHSQALSTLAGRQVFIKVYLPDHDEHNDHNDDDDDDNGDGDGDLDLGKEFKADIDDNDENMMMMIICCC